MPPTDKLLRIINAKHAFSPGAPIMRKSLFAGRSNQITLGIDAVFQRGMHAIVFGERGVGKTSMANCLAEFIPNPHDDPELEPRFITPRVNCTGASNYESVWREIFSKITFSEEFKRAGFTADQGEVLRNIGQTLPRKITPAEVQQGLDIAARKNDLIVVIDEFDKLRGLESRRLMADTLKALSDHSVGATLLLVGIGDTINELIAEHQSVSRCLKQIHMPRMTPSEIRELVLSGIKRLNDDCGDLMLETDDAAIACITTLSAGLPYYAHLLAQHACCQALESDHSRLAQIHVMMGLNTALDGIEQPILTAYLRAISSSHQNNLYREVLTAAALAEVDELGYFTPGSLRGPLSKILQRPIDIPTYLRQLNELSDDRRGEILQRDGSPRNYRYRFADAMMIPYSIIRGFKEGKINLEFLRIHNEQ